MDIQETIIKSIKESLSNILGEGINPELKAKMKQLVENTLFKAQAQGEIISLPEIQFYSYEDRFCQRCKYILYEHIDPSAINVTIGSPKRPELCTTCLRQEEEEKEFMYDE